MTRPIQTPRPRRQVRVAGIVAAALVISWGGPAASAYWQTLSSNDGRAKADSILAVVAPTASASAGAATVSWAQGATAAGRQVSSYTVARYSSATGGTKVAAGGGCSGTVTARTCSEAALPSGTWYYTVTPVLGSWAGPESARSIGVTIAAATPPAAPTLSVPAIVNIGNAAGVPVSVTAESGSSVTITVTDTPPAGTQQQTATQTLTANGSVQSTNFNLSAFKDGTITYTAVATNAAGSASAATTATSAKDTVAPTAVVSLNNATGNTAGTAEKGDTVSIKYSADINSASICSSWVNGVQPPDIAGNNVVTVTISSTNILTVTTAGAACTPNIGPVTLSANYVSSGSLTFTGSGSGGNASKVAWNSDTQTLTITLGARSGSASTGVATSSPTVAPPAGVTDNSGNQAVGVSPASTSTSRF
ncbi:hypothetical protein [Pseudarthrobacter sp. NBSH8]|uniref:hypothetical protein n=1 Tax=Pseudarthrobacter sp. NBSH8 TaxID=2596911 RepID=UPI00162A1E74|nr:hypothetical protein [Pseudarthrobacter sp. NBSH8]QNE15798.1 hypothetical protein FYJ92_16205 [Pseudarthrobacter sp. NBSH8]